MFGFITPIPYPFGSERTGYLVNDFDGAVRAAAADGADVLVAPFDDAIGRDVIVQWPGGVDMQLYWHTKAPSYPPLAAIPENRVYVAPTKTDEFVRDYLKFSHGTVIEDDAQAPGSEIGRPGHAFRRVRISSSFGVVTVLATNGFLPYPFGREVAGYGVSDLNATLARGRSAGVSVLTQPFSSDGRQAVIVEFPGGYIAEIHTTP